MNVVHISNTPVAGSPGNIVSALNRLTEIRARHIVFNSSAYRTRTFAVDIDWKTGREEAHDAIAAADIIHIHQFFSLDETFGPGFHGRFGKKKVIRQFHSAPDLWAKGDVALASRIVSENIPQLVIAQGPERYYPFARVVPNIIPLHDPRYLPMEAQDGLPVVMFSPSGRTSAWKTRWETKGAPQTLALLRKLQREGLCKLHLVVDTPHDECLRAKQRAAVVIDECVTGNYHLSGLEALSQGKPTVGYLDQRVQGQLRKITGATELPWVDVRLEEAEAPLRELLANRRLRTALGLASRKWMETYYNEATLIQHYREAYFDLFEAPHRFQVPRFENEGDHWLAVRLPNHHWSARRNARVPFGRAFKALRAWAGIR
ncbi:glycosyltransferase [Paraburkholderia saeva]|uniref:glycosyltransferase n=1 Tax=Paraburkholderia saeva TaxID=2777537 RepID=UPI001E1257C9|nr:hypothetical protein [Paraburkholderia saeva]CAG4886026.1 hypothetical protein R70241_00105 [Paraburkholderia saeva]